VQWQRMSPAVARDRLGEDTFDGSGGSAALCMRLGSGVSKRLHRTRVHMFHCCCLMCMWMYLDGAPRSLIWIPTQWHAHMALRELLNCSEISLFLPSSRSALDARCAVTHSHLSR
jgi:hypothetical protein